MTKKARRARRTRKQANSGKTSTTKPTQRNKQDAAERFRQEYAYVLKDLRQILILAVAMFILLIILNLILPYLV